jgi:hypothetical protein
MAVENKGEEPEGGGLFEILTGQKSLKTFQSEPNYQSFLPQTFKFFMNCISCTFNKNDGQFCVSAWLGYDTQLPN